MPTQPTKPLAIITGAGSGIGLAIATHLLTHSYRVVLAERNPHTGRQAASSLGPDAKFIQCDVSDQKSQARMFKEAFEWGGNRVDFFHANAGVDDRQSLYEVFEKEGEGVLDGEGLVKGLNTGCLGVNLEGVVQGLWLFRWYFGRSEGREGRKGRFVATSSAAGL
jgi:NAD(P)-dependent dehydrogenase (short-subunit alcohol dehydrogenase family)